MNTPDWIDVLRVTGVTARRKGRHCYAVVREDGTVYAAEALADDATGTDAQMGVLSTLLQHPDLVGQPIDFVTNDRKLAATLAEERRLLPNVEPIDGSLLAVGFSGLHDAETLAHQAADDRGPVPLLAATDGSKEKYHPRGGYGWVTADGRHGHGPIEPTSVVEAELVAIAKLLDNLHGDQPLVVLVDSTHARSLARRALAGQNPPANTVNAVGEVYDKIKRHQGRAVTFRNVAGHSGDPLNTCADSLAVGARRGAREGYSEQLVAERAHNVVAEMRHRLAAAVAAA